MAQSTEQLVSQSRLLSSIAVRELLGIGPWKLWQLSNLKSDNKLPSYLIGNRRKFKYDEVMWWVDKQKA